MRAVLKGIIAQGEAALRRTEFAALRTAATFWQIGG